MEIKLTDKERKEIQIIAKREISRALRQISNDLADEVIKYENEVS